MHVRIMEKNQAIVLSKIIFKYTTINKETSPFYRGVVSLKFNIANTTSYFLLIRAFSVSWFSFFVEKSAPF